MRALLPLNRAWTAPFIADDEMTDPDPSSTNTAPGRQNGAGDKSHTGFLNRLKRLIGLKPDTSLREDLAGALSRTEEEADEAFTPEERAMLRNVLGLRERRVDDAMVPRADIIAVDQSISMGDLLNVFREAGHSRFPVYRDSLDDPVGMVHIKDVMNMITSSAALSKSALARRKTPLPGALELKKVNLSRSLASTRLIRKVLFIPPSMRAIDLLAQMQATRIHMGIIIDEYGGTDGLVTIEDLMEEIVGEIEDEHDTEATPTIEADGENGFIADARVSIEELSEALAIDLTGDEAAEEVDTLGGFVFTLLGRVPVRGEIISYGEGLEFEVLDADPRRIKGVRITRRSGGVSPARRDAQEAAKTISGKNGVNGTVEQLGSEAAPGDEGSNAAKTSKKSAVGGTGATEPNGQTSGWSG